MKQSHNTRVLHGSLPRRKLHPQELCFIISWESTHNSAATYYAAWDLLGNSTHSAGSPSLLDLFSSYIAFFLQYILSLSLSQSLRIVTFMLKDLATGYSKITIDLTTELELNSSSMSYNTDNN